MVKRKRDTKWMVGVALMGAIVVLLATTPLGIIMLPVTKATTVHIPVILGSVVFGPLAGAILGGVFGLCSLINNTLTPNLTSFAFSPFMSTTGIPGAIKAIWISTGCRMMIGVIAGWLWIFLKKCKVSDKLALPIVGFVGSMSNTVLVLGSIYFLLAEQYAQAQNVAVGAVLGMVMGTVAFNGVPEALAATVLTAAIGTALLRVAGRKSK